MAKYRWYLEKGKIDNEVTLKCQDEDDIDWFICTLKPSGHEGSYYIMLHNDLPAALFSTEDHVSSSGFEEEDYIKVLYE